MVLLKLLILIQIIKWIFCFKSTQFNQNLSFHVNNMFTIDYLEKISINSKVTISDGGLLSFSGKITMIPFYFNFAGLFCSAPLYTCNFNNVICQSLMVSSNITRICPKRKWNSNSNLREMFIKQI